MLSLFPHIIITGGSSGIGKALGKLLVSEGSNLTIIARTSEKLEIAKQEIASHCISDQQEILTLNADVSNQNQIQTAINKAIEHLGTPKLLITSAGIAHPGYFSTLPLSIFEETMNINYLGTLYSIKAVLPSMKQAQQGQIVMISSGAGLTGIFGYSAYSPSKFAVRGLAESLRGELKLDNIDLSIVYPPDTDTPQLQYENQFKPPATKKITATAKIFTADKVAQIILNGIKSRQFMITPGLEMKILARFHSLLQPVINYYFERIIKTTQLN